MLAGPAGRFWYSEAVRSAAEVCTTNLSAADTPKRKGKMSAALASWELSSTNIETWQA
jgi:hypothetical protein